MYKEIFKTEQPLEGPFGPSMVEPCHNLSLEELLRDYTRGIVHSERQAFYDDGEDVPDEPPFVPHDLSEAEGFGPGREVGKPSGTTEDEQSEDEGSKEGPGTEADEGGEGSGEGA